MTGRSENGNILNHLLGKNYFSLLKIDAVSLILTYREGSDGGSESGK